MSASVQTQALSAILFLYRHVVGREAGSASCPRKSASGGALRPLGRDPLDKALGRTASRSSNSWSAFCERPICLQNGPRCG